MTRRFTSGYGGQFFLQNAATNLINQQQQNQQDAQQTEAFKRIFKSMNPNAQGLENVTSPQSAEIFNRLFQVKQNKEQLQRRNAMLTGDYQAFLNSGGQDTPAMQKLFKEKNLALDEHIAQFGDSQHKRAFENQIVPDHVLINAGYSSLVGQNITYADAKTQGIPLKVNKVKPKSFGQIEAGIFKKAQDGETLTPLEQKLLNKKVEGKRRIIKNSKGINIYADTGEKVITSDEGIKKTLPANTIKSLTNSKSLLSVIDRIGTLATLNPGDIGVLNGLWTEAKNLFISNPQGTELARSIDSLIRTAYDLSGKQISEQELDRLKKFLIPSLTLPIDNFRVALKMSKNNLKNRMSNQLKGYTAGGYNTAKLAKLLTPDTGNGDNSNKDASKMSNAELMNQLNKKF